MLVLIGVDQDPVEVDPNLVRIRTWKILEVLRISNIYQVVWSLFLVKIYLSEIINISQRCVYCLNRSELALMPKNKIDVGNKV